MVRQRKPKRFSWIVLVMPNVVHSSLIPNSQDSIIFHNAMLLKEKDKGNDGNKSSSSNNNNEEGTKKEKKTRERKR